MVDVFRSMNHHENHTIRLRLLSLFLDRSVHCPFCRTLSTMAANVLYTFSSNHSHYVNATPLFHHGGLAHIFSALVQVPFSCSKFPSHIRFLPLFELTAQYGGDNKGEVEVPRTESGPRSETQTQQSKACCRETTLQRPLHC